MSTLHHESILEDCLIEAEENFRVHNKLIESDFDYISHVIRFRYLTGQQLNTITGLNKILQIRTKDSKPYHPVTWEGRQLKNKSMGFYLTGKYAKTIV